MSEHVEALEQAIRDGDVKRGLRAASALMEEAETQADLAAAATAIDSNLAKLDEIKVLRAERDRYREAAEVFAHYYDAICDQLESTELAYLRARGTLNQRYLEAREALAASATKERTTDG